MKIIWETNEFNAILYPEYKAIRIEDDRHTIVVGIDEFRQFVKEFIKLDDESEG